jgi:hypothetical protein
MQPTKVNTVPAEQVIIGDVTECDISCMSLPFGTDGIRKAPR